jgi:hypothetical protein
MNGPDGIIEALVRQRAKKYPPDLDLDRGNRLGATLVLRATPIANAAQLAAGSRYAPPRAPS